MASGAMPRSTDEWLMSRSCQRATFSSAGITAERTRRARPVRFSVRIGLRLCGMDEEPFWPASNGSSASSTSVRCRWRISVASRSIDAATTARCGEIGGVAVARDHLGGDRLDRQAQLLAPRAPRPADRRWRRSRPARRWRRWRSRSGPSPAARGRGRTRRSGRRASARRWSARRGCRGCGRRSASACARSARRFSAASTSSTSSSSRSVARRAAPPAPCR